MTNYPLRLAEALMEDARVLARARAVLGLVPDRAPMEGDEMPSRMTCADGAHPGRAFKVRLSRGAILAPASASAGLAPPAQAVDKHRPESRIAA
jgi:hypothetical protein